MVELSTMDTTADPCCAPEQQVTCCEPSVKAHCCGHEESCGCDATTATASATIRARKPIESPA
jgi:hypothetical protein